MRAPYGMGQIRKKMTATKTHKVTLIPGDGIGPEVTQAVVRILEATGVKWSGSALPPAQRH